MSKEQGIWQLCDISSQLSYFPCILAILLKLIKPTGVYVIKPRANMLQIALQLLKQQRYRLKIHLRIGLTAAQISEKMNKTPGLIGAMPTLEEGSLLADTYYYIYGTSRKALIAQGKNWLKFYKKTLWARYQKTTRAKNIEQAVILASIVGKECEIGEYEQVADVLFNRLEQSMRLQACCTVVYFTQQSRVLQNHLKIQNPYNTYRNRGLPPTPIGLVSKEVLERVLRAGKSSNLFYVKNGIDHRHNFSPTFELHRKHKNLWKKTLQKDTCSKKSVLVAGQG